MAIKNLHLEHLEDEIINNGIDGGRASINFLRELRDMLKGHSNKRVNMTVKWDGAPAIWAGKHPEDGRFFIAKKSLFNKTPLFYTSEQEIKDATELSGDLETKFLEAFKYLSKLSWGDTILQGDLMFTDSDKKTETIGNLDYVTFQPNTIKYAAVTGSPLAGAIMTAKLGIVFHTSYTGSSIEELSAKFGANISSLGANKDIWMDDASYKDVKGNASMLAKEAVALTKHLSSVGKEFRNIKRKDLENFRKINKMFADKGAVGASYKTYANAQIRSGKFNPTYEGFLSHVDKYWEDKMIAKVKREETKKIKREIKEQSLVQLRKLKTLIKALTSFQRELIGAKKIIIDSLNRVKSIGTFVKTDTGYKVVNPEGYVAIDQEGKAVKLVDRMEFSLNNFTVAKNWDK